MPSNAFAFGGIFSAKYQGWRSTNHLEPCKIQVQSQPQNC